MNNVLIVEGTDEVEAPVEAGVPEDIALDPLLVPCHPLVLSPVLGHVLGPVLGLVLGLGLAPAHQGEHNFPSSFGAWGGYLIIWQFVHLEN